MKVETIMTPDGKTRYLLVDDMGEPIEPVYRFLKWKDNAGRQRNTLRAYCYQLKGLFEFLCQKHHDYRDLGLDELAEFIRWLQTPHRQANVSALSPAQSPLQARTVNAYLSCVLEFYDYLMRQEDSSLQLAHTWSRLPIHILAVLCGGYPHINDTG